jgi:NADPH2:quinone reductase
MHPVENPPPVAETHQVIDASLQQKRVERGVLQPGWVWLRTAAAGINRADLLQAAGLYPAPSGDSPYLGLEAAGIRLDTGVRVAALCPGCGYSDVAAVPAAWCLPVPAEMPFSVAAALPEALFTWAAFGLPVVTPGARVLIIGAAGGLGHIGVQLFTALGCVVTATAGGAEKAAFVARCGAAQVVDYRAKGLLEGLQGQRFDVIFDVLGGAVSGGLLRLLDVGGTLVQLSVQQGAAADGIPVGQLLVKRLRWQGGTLRGLPHDAKDALADTVRSQLWPLVLSGAITPHIHARFGYNQIPAAHALLNAGNVCGKLVLGDIPPD